MARVTVLTGAPWSDRESRIDALTADRLPRARLIVPSQSYARVRAEQLLRRSGAPGLWDEVVVGFTRLAQLILESADLSADPLDELDRTLIIQRALAEIAGDPARRDVLDPIPQAGRGDGLVRHLLTVVEGLKQAAVEPDTFRRRVAGRAHPSRFDRLVAEVYDAYQALLISDGVYDRIGLFWQAELLCRQGRPAWLRDVDFLAFDGFDDFTPSELRLLEGLANISDDVVIGVPCDLEPEHGDLFALQTATVNTLIARLHAEHAVAEAAPPVTAIGYAAQRLLYRGDAPAAPDFAANLRVQPCGGGSQQTEWVAREVKTLLLDGVPPEDIAVVARDIVSGAPALRACFARIGAPLRPHARPRLTESGVCTLILTAIEATDRWPRDDIADLLAHPWLRLGQSPPVSSAGTLAHIAEVRGGLADWSASLERLCSGLSAERVPWNLRDYRRLPDIATQAECLRARLVALITEAEQLPNRAPMADMASAVDRFVANLGLREGLREAPPDVAAWESAALDAFLNLLGRLSRGIPDLAEPLSRSDLPTFLRAAMRTQEFDPPTAPGIACMDLERARNLRFDHVFLIDANEGALPRAPRINAIYSEEDLQDLERQGVPIETRRHRAQRELVLFHRVLCMARQSLTITWRNATSDGKELRRSPYLIDLIALLSPSIEAAPPRVDAFVPPPTRASCDAELRVAAVYDERIASWFPDIMAPVARGARIEQRRYTNADFDAHDGALADPAVVSAIAARFAPEHTFSPAQIDEYLTCPHRFFARRVLGAAFVDPPTDELNALERGSILHDALERIYAALGDAALPDVNANALDKMIDEALSEAVRRAVAARFGALRALTIAEGRKLARDLRVYAYHVRKRVDERRWRPIAFEVAFGRAGDPDANGDDAPRPSFVLRTDAGPVRFSGRIDRIDACDGDPARLRVVDYKSGQPPSATEVQNGSAVQLPLYVLALEDALYPDAECIEARYFPVGGRPRVKPDLVRDSEEGWQRLLQPAIDAVQRALEGIRSGRFPPLPRKEDVCKYCDARRQCRYEKARIQRKPGGDTRDDEVESGATGRD